MRTATASILCTPSRAWAASTPVALHIVSDTIHQRFRHKINQNIPQALSSLGQHCSLVHENTLGMDGLNVVHPFRPPELFVGDDHSASRKDETEYAYDQGREPVLDLHGGHGDWVGFEDSKASKEKLGQGWNFWCELLM